MTIRLHLDQHADAVYLRLGDSTIVESEEVQPGIVLDFDERGHVVGIEILHVQEHLPLADLKKVQVEFA